MPNMLLQYAYIFVFLSFYVDKGDGRLKKTTKDTLKHDLKLYEKILDRLNWDLETFNEEYPDDPSLDYYQDELQQLNTAVKNNPQTKPTLSKKNFDDIRQHKSVEKALVLKDTVRRENLINVTNKKYQKNDWPKFEDMLISIGKKYDWKNDRWVKIKKNDNNMSKAGIAALKTIEFHEKHNFKYRIVKLNRTKSKRNIVIAVTAVR